MHCAEGCCTATTITHIYIKQEAAILSIEEVAELIGEYTGIMTSRSGPKKKTSYKVVGESGGQCDSLIFFLLKETITKAVFLLYYRPYSFPSDGIIFFDIFE